MDIHAVQMHEVRGPRAEGRAQAIGERAAVVLVVREDASAEHTAQVVPDSAERGALAGNRRRLGHGRGHAPQHAARGVPRVLVRLVTLAGERHHIHIILHRELPQDVEGAAGDATMGWEGETMGQKQQARATRHWQGAPYLRAARGSVTFCRATARAASGYSISENASDRKNPPTEKATSAAIRLCASRGTAIAAGPRRRP